MTYNKTKDVFKIQIHLGSNGKPIWSIGIFSLTLLSLNVQRPPQAVVSTLFALCMVEVVETPSRLLNDRGHLNRGLSYFLKSSEMEIEQNTPVEVIKVPKSKIYPGSFVVRNKGNCMDSEQAVMRVRNGDYMLCHPIEIEEAVGKVVVISTPVDHYTKQVIELTPSYLIVGCFKPYLTNVFIPLSDVKRIYSVDEILKNPKIEKLESVE